MIPTKTGTSNKRDFFFVDDMLFLTKTKQNRAGQTKVDYKWTGGRIPYTFAPGYCKFCFVANF